MHCKHLGCSLSCHWDMSHTGIWGLFHCKERSFLLQTWNLSYIEHTVDERWSSNVNSYQEESHTRLYEELFHFRRWLKGSSCHLASSVHIQKDRLSDHTYHLTWPSRQGKSTSYTCPENLLLNIWWRHSCCQFDEFQTDSWGKQLEQRRVRLTEPCDLDSCT